MPPGFSSPLLTFCNGRYVEWVSKAHPPIMQDVHSFPAYA